MDKIWVLYKPPIKIDDIESAVRASGEIYGMEPRISRSQEFLLVFAAPRGRFSPKYNDTLRNNIHAA